MTIYRRISLTIDSIPIWPRRLTILIVLISRSNPHSPYYFCVSNGVAEPPFYRPRLGFPTSRTKLDLASLLQLQSSLGLLQCHKVPIFTYHEIRKEQFVAKCLHSSQSYVFTLEMASHLYSYVL
ncbi:hypothetical protein VNO77_34704 [Canavalia gladiata]|uniref:Uncharacterized protein n=1 Tax=Canavalia gladiata TaxID=3824 RepID=A0AAN9KEL8_CANGL